MTGTYCDWRGRLVATKSAVQSTESTSDNTHFIICLDLNSLGQATAVLVYDGDNVAVAETGGTPDRPSASLLRGRSKSKKGTSLPCLDPHR